MADRHIVTKHGIHEMANQAGMAATFMAKYNTDQLGSGCHIHSLSVEWGLIDRSLNIRNYCHYLEEGVIDRSLNFEN